MSTPIQLVENKTVSAADTPEIIFTDDGTGNGTVIDAFTASNTSAANRSYKAYIVPSGGSASNPQKPFQIVVWGEIDLGSGVVNQVIPASGSLYVEVSAANSIYFTVSGKKV